MIKIEKCASFSDGGEDVFYCIIPEKEYHKLTAFAIISGYSLVELARGTGCYLGEPLPVAHRWYVYKSWDIHKVIIDYINIYYNNDNNIRCEGVGSSYSSLPE